MTHQTDRFSSSDTGSSSPHFMKLELMKLATEQVVGIYGKKENQLPDRMRYLHPASAKSFIADLSEHVQVSDMYRSAESSLRARKTRKGAQRPAFSGHNYGFSIDLDVSGTMKRLGIKKKRLLDEWMAERGWWCHRRDHRRKHEEWHYNFFGDEFELFVKPNDHRTSTGLERKIVKYYGRWWQKADNRAVQRMLTRLGMYDGDIDGKIGAISRQGIRAFQRAWIVGHKPTGKADKRTVRTLAFVSADKALIS